MGDDLAGGCTADNEKVAAATCQKSTSVQMGLLWLEAKGLVKVLHRSENLYWIAEGSGAERGDLIEIGTELSLMLAETAAYRAYFKNASNQIT